MSISILLIIVIYDTAETCILHRSSVIIQKDDHEILLNQTLVNDLAEKISDQQYLKDVSDSKLRLLLLHDDYHHAVPLQPIVQATQQHDITSRKTISSNQQCLYQNKIYSIGEIIQTDNGWVRCTQIFHSDINGALKYLRAMWIFQDKLL